MNNEKILNFLILCKIISEKGEKSDYVWQFGCLEVIVRQIDHKKESTQKKSQEIRGCSKNVYCSDTPQKSYIMAFFVTAMKMADSISHQW